MVNKTLSWAEEIREHSLHSSFWEKLKDVISSCPTQDPMDSLPRVSAMDCMDDVLP